MREGTSSLTAQRVAAHRGEFERLPALFGDVAADQRLTRDVAGSRPFAPDERMARYLQSRTAFFDRVVVNGLARGVTQVVAIGAGYDARALRYAKPGVRWFEVDHPATQADKRQRLEQLRIDSQGTPETRSRRRHRCSTAPRRGSPPSSTMTSTPCGEPWPGPRTARGSPRP